MNRVHGTVGVQQIECINRNRNRWAMRMDVQPDTEIHMEDEEPNPDAVTYYEKWIEKEPDIDDIKKFAIECVEDYDNSSNVNEFTVEGHKDWKDYTKRMSLARDCEIARKKGLSTVIYWTNDGTSIEMPIDVAVSRLDDLEEYAWQTFNVTSMHKNEINGMDNNESILGYDIREGYPEKLIFN